MATSLAAAVNPIPYDLRSKLPDPESPWMVSPGVRERLLQTGGDYQKTLLTPADPEYAFVSQYFGASPPRNRMIGRIYCVHNAGLARQFEAALYPLREEAGSPVFSPKWHQEDNPALRGKVIARWEAMSAQFSPFYIAWPDRKDRFDTVKILPLWQGSNAAKCDSICKTGFASFGKHAIIQGSSDASQNTDIGFFGSGIYFTPSARYAADIYSPGEGHLLLSWTCMRTPYPVIADKPCPPGKPRDMRILEGNSAYQNYNAHYIPVRPTEPDNPHCPVYYPCAEGQVPTTDEIVVFGKQQTLPRFWVQLEVAFPKAPAAPSATIHELFQKILDLLEKPMIQSDPHVYQLLEEKSENLLEQNQEAPLDPQNQEFYKWTRQLLDETGKVRSFVAKKLGGAKAAVQPEPASAPAPKPAVAAVVLKPAASAAMSTPMVAPPQVAHVALQPAQLSALAFGRVQWAMHLGDVDEEPPLPADIEKILASPCPFWPGKKVAETHMLTLIPARVNGQPLTLKLIGELVKAPRKGNATKYRGFYPGEYTDPPVGKAHWALMTRDVLEGTRNKPYAEQLKIVATKAPYEVPTILDAAVSIFVEHVRSGVRLYGDTPWTYTRCQEKYDSKYQLAVGGFAPAGLLVYGDCYLDNDNLGVACLRKFWS